MYPQEVMVNTRHVHNQAVFAVIDKVFVEYFV